MPGPLAPASVSSSMEVAKLAVLTRCPALLTSEIRVPSECRPVRTQQMDLVDYA